MAEAVRVEGLSELFRSFEEADRGLGREVKSALEDAGEVVRVAAQDRAASRIHNIGAGWDRMRIGISRDIVYIAPRQRGTRDPRLKRPKFGRLLVAEAMEPALQENREIVAKEVEDAIDNLNQNAGLLKNLHALT
jgi:hypothetical protein